MFPPYNFYWFRINTKHMAEPWLDQALMDSEYKSAVSTTTWLFNVKKYKIYNLFSRFGQLNSYKAVHADRQCTSCTYVKKLWYKINLLINEFLLYTKYLYLCVCLFQCPIIMSYWKVGIWIVLSFIIVFILKICLKINEHLSLVVKQYK